MLEILQKAFAERHKQGGKPQTILIDVTESPMECPKKNKKNGIPAKKTAYHQVAIDC